MSIFYIFVHGGDAKFCVVTTFKGKLQNSMSHDTFKAVCPLFL